MAVRAPWPVSEPRTERAPQAKSEPSMQRAPVLKSEPSAGRAPFYESASGNRQRRRVAVGAPPMTLRKLECWMCGAIAYGGGPFRHPGRPGMNCGCRCHGQKSTEEDDERNDRRRKG